MKLRVIRAAKLSDALAQLRAELGEDAVLLSTRRVHGGVEVTAAQDQLDDEPLMIAPDAPRARPIPPDLARHNVPAALAQRLAEGRLPAALDSVLGFAKLPLGPAPLLLAGPPGAGKTLTTAKLATRLVLAGTRPLLISADGRRAGAAEQLAAFARVLELPLGIANTPSALGKALARRAAGQPVLVDLPGCDPFNPAGARGLAAMLDVARGACVLVLPAGLDAEEAAETASAFQLLGCRYLLPTRLDSARRLGSVLAAAAVGLKLTEAGTGPDASDGLEPLTAEALARRLAAPPAMQERA
ncbi:flagellar biosynthesis protein FlhF [Falsiroseomonas tokyonensis]|uniref:GTP-binding protein n=1 Tax=Falsiroseomonas tokyonensis TaxID=430521 RepID=A0ABV7BVL1_9PROT|nr:GTP-binding protein [Falsiroseomonas tokyonensis]MBU8538515.1 GTP-binding protein [Falsiroseomonas tokyonensis]